MSERKIVDYIIVCSTSMTNIQERVLSHASQGYELQGGICVQGDIPDPHVILTKTPLYYHQAMVKYADN